ncbi:DUF3243 domain-containing protein [Metabacillus litoralis]|uniref:DUF3243 domain-containing protein n=1 Tax=Metabacillus litoralis TaxID=152268 RepID=UPI001CFEC60D|nr:DUF3243 domain-containing protein [Metabacillus litoralis]
MEHKSTEEKSAKINKVERAVDSLSEEKIDDILANFESFKDYLGDKVHMGKKMGLTEEQLAIAAQKVGNFLSEHEQARNREEKLLQELWIVGSEEEQHMLSHMLVKLVKEK